MWQGWSCYVVWAGQDTVYSPGQVVAWQLHSVGWAWGAQDTAAWGGQGTVPSMFGKFCV